MHSFLLVMIAVSLSMDAFSLSLAYGTLNLDKKKIYTLTTIVGIYHFFMPLLGYKIGTIIMNLLPLNPNILVFLVLLLIGIQMIFDSFKEEKIETLTSFSQLLIFGFAVAIDSFSVGLGFSSLTNQYGLVALLFALSSAFFTYLGLQLGKQINKKIGKFSTIIGGVFLILIGIVYLF